MPNLSPRAGTDVCSPSLTVGCEPAEKDRRGVINRLEASDAIRKTLHFMLA